MRLLTCGKPHMRRDAHPSHRTDSPQTLSNLLVGARETAYALAVSPSVLDAGVVVNTIVKALKYVGVRVCCALHRQVAIFRELMADVSFVKDLKECRCAQKRS